MATIRKEFRSPRPPAEVWDALKDFPAVHERLAKGFVTATRMEPSGARVVTFVNGAEAREWPVTSDDAERRLVYAIKDLPGFTHYSAAAQVFDEKNGARDQNRDAELTKLHAKIGQLVVERDFLSKAFDR